MIEALSITIDRYPKERLRKKEKEPKRQDAKNI